MFGYTIWCIKPCALPTDGPFNRYLLPTVPSPLAKHDFLALSLSASINSLRPNYADATERRIKVTKPFCCLTSSSLEVNIHFHFHFARLFLEILRNSWKPRENRNGNESPPPVHCSNSISIYYQAPNHIDLQKEKKKSRCHPSCFELIILH